MASGFFSRNCGQHPNHWVMTRY